MIKAKVLSSRAHREDSYERFENNLSAEILWETSPRPLTSETLKKYTSVALINPKTIPEVEKEAIIQFYNEGGGVFLDFNILNETHYEEFIRQNADFLKEIFRVEVKAKRVLPEIELGDFDIEFKGKGLEGLFSGKAMHREKVRAEGRYALRAIRYVPKPFLLNEGKEFEISENDSDFITFFVGAEKSRVILKRGTSPRPKFFYTYYFDNTFHPIGAFGESYLLDDDSHADWHRRDDYRVTKDCWKLLKKGIMQELNNYEDVGVISDILQTGRAVCLLSNKLFEEIGDEGEFAKEAQSSLQNIFIRISEPTRYRLAHEEPLPSPPPEIEIMEQIGGEKGGNEIATAQQRIQGLEARIREAPDSVPLILAYKASELYNFLKDGTIGDVLIAMKDTGEKMQGLGDSRKFGSTILHYYTEYFGPEQTQYPVPDNTEMSVYLTFKPQLVKQVRLLRTTLKEAKTYYAEMAGVSK